MLAEKAENAGCCNRKKKENTPSPSANTQTQAHIWKLIDMEPFNTENWPSVYSNRISLRWPQPRSSIQQFVGLMLHRWKKNLVLKDIFKF